MIWQITISNTFSLKHNFYLHYKIIENVFQGRNMTQLHRLAKRKEFQDELQLSD